MNEQGFVPAKVSLRAGMPARITFVRTTEKTCGTEVVFPSLNIKRALPLNQPVQIEFMPSTTGEIAFACGMNMFKGVVVVECLKQSRDRTASAFAADHAFATDILGMSVSDRQTLGGLTQFVVVPLVSD